MMQQQSQVAPASHKHWLILILVLSVVVRVAVALYLGDVVDAPPMLTDQRSYHALGQRLVEGHGFTFDSNWYPFTPAEEPTAHWSFLYSLLVAGVYAVLGVHPLAVRLVQSVAGGALLPWVVYRLARRYFPQRPSVWLWSAALAAGYAYYVLYAATIMTETVYITLLVVSMDLSLQVSDSIATTGVVPRKTAVLLGLTMGATALARQSILPWLPVLYLWFLAQAGRGERQALSRYLPLLGRLFLSGMMILLLILPWTWRNYRAYGTFLLLNSNAGYAMYSAQHPMHGTVFQEYEAAPLPGGIWLENEAVKDKALMRIGISFVAAEPWRYVRLCLSRARAMIEFWPSAGTTLLHNLGRVGSFGLYLPFYLAGWLMVLRRPVWRKRMVLPALFAAFYAILHILTWAMVRYRLPIDAVLMPVAAVAVDRAASWLWTRFRGR